MPVDGLVPVLVVVDTWNLRGQCRDLLGEGRFPSVDGIRRGLTAFGFDALHIYETVHTRPGSWLLLGDSVMIDFCGRATGSTQGARRRAALVDQLLSHRTARRWTYRYRDVRSGLHVWRHRSGIEGTLASGRLWRPGNTEELFPVGVDFGPASAGLPEIVPVPITGRGAVGSVGRGEGRAMVAADPDGGADGGRSGAHARGATGLCRQPRQGPDGRPARRSGAAGRNHRRPCPDRRVGRSDPAAAGGDDRPGRLRRSAGAGPAARRPGSRDGAAERDPTISRRPVRSRARAGRRRSDIPCDSGVLRSALTHGPQLRKMDLRAL
jgi:hypothetical protein